MLPAPCGQDRSRDGAGATQAAVLQHIVLDLLIGGLVLRAGDVQLIQLQINVDMLRGIVRRGC